MVENINNIQLRAARHAVGLGVREIAKLLGVGPSTVGNHERIGVGKKAAENFFKEHSEKLIKFFKDEHNIIFPDYYSIELMVSEEVLKNLPKDGGELTRFQLRCARCMLNISQAALSKCTGIGERLLSQKEVKTNEELLYMSHSNGEVELVLQKWFFYHGIEFIDRFKIKFKKTLALSTIGLLRSEPVKSVKQKKEVMPT